MRVRNLISLMGVISSSVTEQNYNESWNKMNEEMTGSMSSFDVS